MSNENSLPYDFDLHYDIKTKEQLASELKWAKRKVETLESLIEHHGIDLSDVSVEDAW